MAGIPVKVDIPTLYKIITPHRSNLMKRLGRSPGFASSYSLSFPSTHLVLSGHIGFIHITVAGAASDFHRLPFSLC